jgi:hypothetical protein
MPRRVRLPEGFARRHEHVGDLLQREPLLAFEPRREGFSGEQLHHEVGHLVVDAVVVDLHDVGALQLRGAAFASRSKRPRASLESRIAGSMNFTATERSRALSRATQTEPMPPFAMARSSWYLPAMSRPGVGALDIGKTMRPRRRLSRRYPRLPRRVPTPIVRLASAKRRTEPALRGTTAAPNARSVDTTPTARGRAIDEHFCAERGEGARDAVGIHTGREHGPLALRAPGPAPGP